MNEPSVYSERHSYWLRAAWHDNPYSEYFSLFTEAIPLQQYFHVVPNKDSYHLVPNTWNATFDTNFEMKSLSPFIAPEMGSRRRGVITLYLLRQMGYFVFRMDIEFVKSLFPSIHYSTEDMTRFLERCYYAYLNRVRCTYFKDANNDRME